MIRRLRVWFLSGLILSSGCSFAEAEKKPRLSLFVGVDVSGSFRQSPSFKEGIRFLSYYMYAHLNGIGGMEKPRALYVGSIGGDAANEPKAFYPIQAFERKSVQQIEDELLRYFGVRGNFYTDFNAFFKRISETVQKRNLILAPINIVILSDGVPDVLGPKGKKVIRGNYKNIDVSPLEYLARNVTVRILYPSPKVSAAWEHEIPRYRVRIWPVEAQIMEGWVEQLSDQRNVENEERLWNWIHEIVNRRVRRQRIL